MFLQQELFPLLYLFQQQQWKCRYLNLDKNLKIILEQIENSQVATTLFFFYRLLQSLPSFFFTYLVLARKPKLENFSICSNKFFHNFHLSESNFTCTGQVGQREDCYGKDIFSFNFASKGIFLPDLKGNNSLLKCIILEWNRKCANGPLHQCNKPGRLSYAALYDQSLL